MCLPFRCMRKNNHRKIVKMVIDKALLDDLTGRAKASPRLRMNLDLRNSAEDSSQRMLNAIEPGTVILDCKDGKWLPMG